MKFESSQRSHIEEARSGKPERAFCIAADGLTPRTASPGNYDHPLLRGHSTIRVFSSMRRSRFPGSVASSRKAKVVHFVQPHFLKGTLR